MANVIKHKRAALVPDPADVVVGEIAINTATGILHTKTDAAAIMRVPGRYELTFTATGGKTVTHNLGTRYVHVSVYNSTGALVVVGVATTDTNNLDLVFTGTLTSAVVVVLG